MISIGIERPSKPGRVGRHDEQRRLAASRSGRPRCRADDQHRLRLVDPGDVRLAAGQDPVVAVRAGRCVVILCELEPASGSVIAKAIFSAPSAKPGSQRLLLLLGAGPGDDRGADGRRDDHQQQRAARGGQLLAHDGQLEDAAAAAAVLLRHVHAEVAEPAGLGPQLVGLLAGPGLLQQVRVAVAPGQLRPPTCAAAAARRSRRSPSALRVSASTTASTSPASTCDPAATRSSVTTPAAGASTGCSIFIASSASSGWPASTRSPLATRTASTCPGIGAGSEPAGSADRVPASAVHLGQRHRAEPGVHVGHVPDREATRYAVRTPSPLQHDPSGPGRWPPTAPGVRPAEPVGDLDRPVRALVRGRRPAARGCCASRSAGCAAPAPQPGAGPRAASAAASAAAAHLVRAGQRGAAPPACRSRKPVSVSPARNAGRPQHPDQQVPVGRHAVDLGAGPARRPACGRPRPGSGRGRSPWPASGRSAARPSSPSTTPESHRGRRRRHRRSRCSVPGRRPPARGRVLGVEPGLDRVPARRRRLGEGSGSPSATASCSATRSRPGDRTR